MQDSLLDDEFIHNAKSDFSTEEALRINRIKTELNDQTARLKQGKTALWALVGLKLLGGIILYASINDPELKLDVLIGGAIITVLFAIAAAAFSFYKKAALIAGFGLYVLLMLADIFADPSSIISGIAVKIAVFYFMIRAIVAAFKSTEYRKQLFTLGVPESELILIDDLRDLRKTLHTID